MAESIGQGEGKWSAINLNEIYSRFPLDYSRDNTLFKLSDNKDLRQLFSHGVYEKSIVDTLNLCYPENLKAVKAPKIRDSFALDPEETYEGDDYYQLQYFKHYDKLIKNGDKEVALPKQSGDLVPRYDKYGIAFCDVKGTNVKKGLNTFGKGAIGLDNEMTYVLAAKRLYRLPYRTSTIEINKIAQHRAMSLIANFQGRTSKYEGLDGDWRAKCANFSFFKEN